MPREDASNEIDYESQEDQSFAATAARFNDNIATAALRLVEANQDFMALIQGFVAAGEALERSLAIHRELGAASQKVLQEARDAAIASASSAAEARDARNATQEAMRKTEADYGAVSGLVDNLQQRISALAMLASPMPRGREEEPSQPVESQDSPDLNDFNSNDDLHTYAA
jgi:hypothetical protein